MPKHDLDTIIFSSILKKHNLGELISVKEIATGLINPVYLLNNNLILRIDLEKYENPDKFKREAILYKILPKFKIPTPDLIAFDDTKDLLDTPYMLISYILGENLLQTFTKLTPTQQKEISFQLGQIAKQIHSLKPNDIGHEDLFSDIDSWAKWTMDDFETQWKLVINTDFLSKVEKDEISVLYEKFKKLNLSDKGRLAHGDFSAGNIQINDGKIVGVFDFEFSFIADPFWDLQKLPISYQLGNNFDQKEFLKGYGGKHFNDDEKMRFRLYCFMQGVWAIWATLTQHMPLSNEKIQEGVELIQNTMKIEM